MVRTKIGVNDAILEQVKSVKYLGCDISCGQSKVMEEKLSKFSRVLELCAECKEEVLRYV